MRQRSWKFHLTSVVTGTLIAGYFGWLAGSSVAGVAIFLFACLVWQLVNSLRLHHWLQSWDNEPPDSHGMWSEIFDGISALQKLNRKRYRQYQSVIDDFQGMADAFPDATLVLDSNDVITWFNDSAVQLLGLRIPDDRGQTVTNLLREPGFADWLLIQDKVQSKLEMPCPTDDNIILQVSAARFREDQRLLILRDITDVRNLERVRHDFVANVSHEMRTPLTVLLGYLEIMQNQPDNPDPKAIKRMFKQARQMHALLEDLLQLSQLQAAEDQNGAVDVDVPALLAHLNELAEDISNGKHEFKFDIQADLFLRGVAADLDSAFQNLIVNAINYTPDGGSVEVQWLESPEGVIFSVKDSGIGIPHRDIPRLTERFYRVASDRARKSGGTGLGLAIVKHVLNAHEARLEILSEPGEGSEFRCIFPVDRKSGLGDPSDTIQQGP